MKSKNLCLSLYGTFLSGTSFVCFAFTLSFHISFEQKNPLWLVFMVLSTHRIGSLFHHKIRKKYVLLFNEFLMFLFCIIFSAVFFCLSGNILFFFFRGCWAPLSKGLPAFFLCKLDKPNNCDYVCILYLWYT